MKRASMQRTIAASIVLLSAAATAAVDESWLNDDTALQQFVDGVMTAQIASGRAVGAAVSIVHGGELVLARGYGSAAVGRNGTAADG